MRLPGMHLRTKLARPRPEFTGNLWSSPIQPIVFHAALARLSGGISPIALLLAYTDWLSHLEASPQRQLEISQEAVRDGKRVFETAQHFFSPQQGPW